MADESNDNPNRYGHNQTTKNQKSWDVKEDVLRVDDNPQQRVDLQVADFDKLLLQKGVEFKVYRTTYCPNVKSVDGGEHEIDCQLCNGSGWMDLDQICTRGYIQNQELERMLEAQGGQHDGNTVLITFPIGIELQYFTRIELVDFTEIYFERILRKPGSSIDILKYKACRVNVVVDKAGVRYFQNQDFTLDPNGNVLWGTGRKPADNLIYSIHYESHIVFRATRAMHVTRFTQYKPAGSAKVEQIKMPQQWMCTKEFLLRRKDIRDNSDLLQGPFDNHQNTTDEDDPEEN